MSANTRNQENRARLRVEHLEKRLVLDRTILDMTHVHIAMEFEGGALSIQLEDTSTKTFYDPSEAVLYLNPNTEAIQPPGWNFIGAGDGNQFWQLPQEKDPSVLTVAFSGEDIDPGTFDTWNPHDSRIGRAGEWIKVSLRDVNGPGEFSMWQDFQAPNAWWMSTVDGGRTFDPAFYLEPGGDNHINAGFTAAGAYMVTFEASAFLNGHGLPIRSDPATLCFGVETTDGCDPGNGPRTSVQDPPASIAVNTGLVSASLLMRTAQGLTMAPRAATPLLSSIDIPAHARPVIELPATIGQRPSLSVVPPFVLGYHSASNDAGAMVGNDFLSVGLAEPFAS